MRIIDTPEMAKLWSMIEPYLTHNKPGVNLSDDAPEEIKEAKEKYFELFKIEEQKELELMFS